MRAEPQCSSLLTLHYLAPCEHDTEQDDDPHGPNIHEYLYDGHEFRAQHHEQDRDRDEACGEGDNAVDYVPGGNDENGRDKRRRRHEQEYEHLPAHFFTPGISIALNLHARKHLPHPTHFSITKTARFFGLLFLPSLRIRSVPGMSIMYIASGG